MSEKIRITSEETNEEVLARIIKATARKYNCDMVIDFSNGSRKVEFIGDEALKPRIAKEVKRIFEKERNG